MSWRNLVICNFNFLSFASYHAINSCLCLSPSQNLNFHPVPNIKPLSTTLPQKRMFLTVFFLWETLTSNGGAPISSPHQSLLVNYRVLLLILINGKVDCSRRGVGDRQRDCANRWKIFPQLSLPKYEKPTPFAESSIRDREKVRGYPGRIQQHEEQTNNKTTNVSQQETKKRYPLSSFRTCLR